MKAATLFALLLVPAALSARGLEAPGLAAKWTTSDPPINLLHIDYGEINRRGEAVGYHHRPNGVDPPGARVERIVQPPDANGIYRARVALRDPATGMWIDKKAPSTFFPDAMSDDEVVEARRLPSRLPTRRRSVHRRFGARLCDRGVVPERAHQRRLPAARPLMPGLISARRHPAGFLEGQARPGSGRRGEILASFLQSDVQGDLETARVLLDETAAAERRESPQPGGAGNVYSITIAPDGAVIRNAVDADALPERYSLPELRAALEIWIEAIERVRRSTDPTAPP